MSQEGPQEIERKFVVPALPEEVPSAPREEILQGYLAVEEAGSEVRVRKKGAGYYLTVKKAGSLVRAEYEVSITPEQFDALWPATEGRRVEKVRYALAYHEQTIEVDVFRGKLQGLVLAEVEFASVPASAHFVPPAWFGREVTYDRRYQNRMMALYGTPE